LLYIATILTENSLPGFGTIRIGVSVVASDGTQKYFNKLSMYLSQFVLTACGGYTGLQGNDVGRGLSQSMDTSTPLIKLQPDGPGIKAR
jgi:hypothetical protein